MTRLLGIDLGRRRIGVAVADTETRGVRPLATIARAAPERDRATIVRLLAEQRVDEIVVGLPVMMDGTVGPQATETHDWAAAALASVGVPITWRDERLTTERATERVGRRLRGASGGPPSGAARRSYRARLDREAAALILQAEIDERAKSDVTG